MKFGDLLKTAIAATFRSKLRTILTATAIFIGAFTLTLTSAVGTGVSAYINTQVASIGTTDSMLVTKTADTSSSSSGPKKYVSSNGSSTQGSGPVAGATSSAVLTTSDITTIKNISGIKSVSPSVQVSPDYIQYSTHGKYVLSLSATSGLTKAGLATGAQLSSSSTENQILIPTNYVKTLGFTSDTDAVGKTVTIGITDYAGKQTTLVATIVGVENETLLGSSVGAGNALTTNLQKAQAVGRPSSIKSNYASARVTYTSSSDVAAIKSRLTKAGFTGQTTGDLLGSFETVINGIVGVLDAFAIIALIAAGFGIVNTLLMSVQERTREIGLMKSMGMDSGRIYVLFSLEAIFIGFLGSAIGALAAIGVGSLISGALSRTVLSGLPGLHLLEFSASDITTIILVVMLIAFLAGTLPARRAARLDPIEALRYE